MKGSRTALDAALLAIRDDILRMASLVHSGIDVNFKALQRGDQAILEAAYQRDREIDHLHRQVEERVVTAIVTQQPVARDVRLIAADLWLASELERMGDYAKGCARITARASTADLNADMPSVMPFMVREVRAMLHDALTAYVARDAEAAREVAARDDAIDDLHKEAKAHILADMGEGRVSLEWGAELLRLARHLERFGDRVTNICERIVYIATADHEELNP